MHQWRMTTYGTPHRPCEREGCSNPAVEGRRLCTEHAPPGMPWDDVMQYEPAARNVAVTWVRKTNGGYTDQWRVDDLTHDLLLHLHLNADPSRANGPVENYVIGLLWKSAISILIDSRAASEERRTVFFDDIAEGMDHSVILEYFGEDVHDSI